MKASPLLLLIAGACVGWTAEHVHAALQLSPAPDALNAAPGEYRLEFENEYVRVTRVTYPPHGHASMHTHPAPGGVVVALTDQDARLTAPDGRVRDGHYKAGSVRWAVSTPGADASTESAHSEENLSDKPFELIRIDPKPSSSATLPVVSKALNELKWTRSTDGTGREIADVFGDRSKAELFGYLVKWPKNTIAKAHSHPDARHAIVLAGTFYHGHGTRFEAGKLERRSAGTYFTEPAGDPHFGATRNQEAVLYFVGIGPDRTDAIEK